MSNVLEIDKDECIGQPMDRGMKTMTFARRPGKTHRISKAPVRSFELGRTNSSTSIIDKYAIVTISACVFAVIAAPLMSFAIPSSEVPQKLIEHRWENRIFWPALAAISAGLAVGNLSRLSRLSLPPHIVCLLMYIVFAGVSVLWALKPEASFSRFVQQMMIVTSIILPGMLAGRSVDLMRCLFLCFAFASILNVIFVIGGSPEFALYGLKMVEIGYAGYFLGKNYLGEFSAAALFLGIYEASRPGLRRAFGIVVIVIAILLLFLSNSKTAFGLALCIPLLAKGILIIRGKMRISIAVIILSIVFCYAALSGIFGLSSTRISYALYGDSTLTGRTIIWDFANKQIERRPFLGWGYQSFWLVGTDAPSVVDAPGWVKLMPNAHNGYYDTMLEMGYVGFALLLIFVVTTLHALGRMADRAPNRAHLVLSLALFILIFNFFESIWMRGYEFLWVLFLMLALEIGRYWQSFPPARAPRGSRIPVRPSSAGFSPGAWRRRAGPELIRNVF